jgi:hypothetical protein
VDTPDNILSELGEIGPIIAALPKNGLMTEIPTGYFESFGADMLRIIELVEVEKKGAPITPALSSLPKINTYAAPVAYFEGLSAQLLSGIHTAQVTHELSTTTPVLATLPKIQVATAPVGYFETFAPAMTRLVTQRDQPLSRRVDSSMDAIYSWIDTYLAPTYRPVYAMVAACIVGLMVCALLIVHRSNSSSDEVLLAQMHQLPDSELHAYVNAHSDEFEEVIQNNHPQDLSTREIESILNETQID